MIFALCGLIVKMKACCFRGFYSIAEKPVNIKIFYLGYLY